jgi:hypothetical protein
MQRLGAFLLGPAALFGLVSHGFSGAATALVAVMGVTSGIAIAAREAGSGVEHTSQRVGGAVAAVACFSSVASGGWSTGWLWGVAGYLLGMIVCAILAKVTGAFGSDGQVTTRKPDERKGMNRFDAETERKPWRAAGVHEIGGLPGFPFSSHAAFVEAVRNREVAVGVEYPAARDLLGITTSKVANLLMLGITWLPFLLALASVPLGLYQRDWLVLGGLFSSPLALILVSPYSPLSKVVFRFSAVACVSILLVGHFATGLHWVVFCFAVSILALTYLNSFAWRSAQSAALESEAFASYLFKSNNLFIRDSSDKIHSARAA